MKFRYYITNLHAGEIQGTNEAHVANTHAASSDYFVLDSENGLWITEFGEMLEVQEVESE